MPSTPMRRCLITSSRSSKDYRQKHRKALLAELKEEMKPSRTLGAVVDVLAKDAKKRVVSIRKKAKARKFRSLGKRGGTGSN
jgi:hypothetical protein